MVKANIKAQVVLMVALILKKPCCQ